MPDTTFVFSIVAAIIIVGFLGELFFRKTGVPMFVFLIVMGILMGPVFGLLSRSQLISSLGVFAELTLLMVLFYGGIDTTIRAALEGGGRAFAQVAIYVVGSTIAIGMVVSILLGWDVLSSLIFASMVGGETTAAVVIPLSRSLKLPDVTVAFLTLESAMNSILSIVIFFALVAVYQTGTGSWLTAFSKIASNFSVGIVLGGILSLAWLVVLNRYQQRKYTYVLTLGLVFVTYVISAQLGGSGELSVLIFGIVLGNYPLINRVARLKLSMDVLQTKLGQFQEEISFLMETLFFVFLGLTFQIASSSILSNLGVGLVVLTVLLAFRFVATTISSEGSELRGDRRAIVLMCAQGLVPATLAIFSVEMGLPHADSFLNIVTYVIILTNVVSSVGAIIRMRSQKAGFREFMAGLERPHKLDHVDPNKGPSTG